MFAVVTPRNNFLLDGFFTDKIDHIVMRARRLTSSRRKQVDLRVLRRSNSIGRARSGYPVSGVARGGPGGPWPPQNFRKMFFFCNEFRKMSRSGRNVKKCSRMKVIRVILTFCYRKKILPLIVIPKNLCYYPPPPPLNLAGLWRSRKIYGTTPPHRVWSACGDHGKVAPPQTKILATPLYPVEGAAALGFRQAFYAVHRA